MRLLIISISIFLISGCVKVNVIQKKNGKIVDKTTYYPFSKQKDIKNWDGITPLHFAAINNDTYKIKKLLNQGADPFAGATDPVKNVKIIPLEMAYLLKNEEATKLLAKYMLQNNKNQLLSDRDKLIEIFALLYKKWPLYSLELSKRYNYPSITNHILKKLYYKSRYNGSSGCVQLVRDIVAKGYKHALEAVALNNTNCVKEAFKLDIEMLKNNFALSEEFVQRLEFVKLYKPYISLQDLNEITNLEKKLKNNIEKRNQAIKNIISEAFSSRSSRDIELRYFNQSNNRITYKMIIKGKSDGIIYANKDKDHYDIGTFNGKFHKSLIGGFYPGTNSLYTPYCGSLNGINSLQNALYKISKCSVYGHY